MTKNNIPPCMIYIDKNGRWFHKGVEMIHREIILEFYRSITRDSHGKYIINYQGDCCYADVEDTPYIIKRVVLKEMEHNSSSRIVLYVNDDTREELSPETLSVGDDNVLYCEIKAGSFSARFSRAAYYQLGEYIKEEGDSYCLPLNGKNYRIRIR
jgi:hypothetical protein